MRRLLILLFLLLAPAVRAQHVAYNRNAMVFCRSLPAPLAALGKGLSENIESERAEVANEKCGSLAKLADAVQNPEMRIFVKQIEATCRAVYERGTEFKSALCGAENLRASQILLYKQRLERAARLPRPQQIRASAYTAVQVEVSDQQISDLGEKFRDVHAALAKELKIGVPAGLPGICRALRTCAARADKFRADAQNPAPSVGIWSGEVQICSPNPVQAEKILQSGLCDDAAAEIAQAQAANGAFLALVGHALHEYEENKNMTEALGEDLKLQAYLISGVRKIAENTRIRDRAQELVIATARDGAAGSAAWDQGLRDLQARRDQACRDPKDAAACADANSNLLFAFDGTRADYNRAAALFVADREEIRITRRLLTLRSALNQRFDWDRLQEAMLKESGLDLRRILKDYSDENLSALKAKRSRLEDVIAAARKGSKVEAVAGKIEHRFFDDHPYRAAIGFGVVSALISASEGEDALAIWKDFSGETVSMWTAIHTTEFIERQSHHFVNEVRAKSLSPVAGAWILRMTPGLMRFLVGPAVVAALRESDEVFLHGNDWSWIQFAGFMAGSSLTSLLRCNSLIIAYTAAKAIADIGARASNIAAINEFRDLSKAPLQAEFVDEIFARSGLPSPFSGYSSAWIKFMRTIGVSK